MPIWINWDYNCNALDPEGIRNFVRKAVEANLQGISIRISNKGTLNYPTNIGESYEERLKAFGGGYDPLRIFIDECKTQHIRSAVWLDLYEGAYSSLLRSNPELSPQGLPGKPGYAGTFSYSEPEVRNYMLAIVNELAKYGPDRIFFCTKSSHIPSGSKLIRNKDAGFNPSAIKRYRKLYGDQIPLSAFDRKKLSLIHGEFLIDFLIDARKLLNAAGIESVVGATVSGRLQIGGNLLLDWRRLIERKAADAICMANSRSEYDVFYNPEGQKLFRQIVEKCHMANMKFYPYIISSGTYSVIADKYGFPALLDYIPRQLQYLQTLDGEGLIIHDLDLFSFNPNIQKALWETVGNYSSLVKLMSLNLPMEVPKIDTTKGTFSVVGKRSEKALYNGSFEYFEDSEKPDGWEPEVSEGGSVSAMYDRKVLHESSVSGRNFDGRSSVLLLVTPEAAKESLRNARASWLTKINFPDRPELKKQMIRVRVHGEDLKGIAKAGMKIEQYDRNHKLINTLNIPAPASGTFPWKAIEAECVFDCRARYAGIYLYLITDETGDATGRLWFDKLEFDSQ